MGVVTVRGTIDAADLGITDIHEHILCNFSNNYEPDPGHPELRYAHVTFDTIGLLTHNPLAIPDNLVLSDEQLAVRELKVYRDAGVKTIVDVTTIEIGRNPAALQRISEATGIHVVAGTGHYIHDFRLPAHENKSVEEIAERMTREIVEGIDDTGVRAGIIGELGTSEKIYPEEARGLRAAARVNKAIGVPLMVHTDPQNRMAIEALNILSTAGANPEKVSICHMDSAFLDEEYLAAILSTGAYIELDTFGENFCMHPNYGPSDLDRVKLLTRLIDQGHVGQIMLASDVCLKCRLHAYGGWGYDHLLTNVLPTMKRFGVTDTYLNTMLVQNPRRYLNF